MRRGVQVSFWEASPTRDTGTEQFKKIHSCFEPSGTRTKEDLIPGCFFWYYEYMDNCVFCKISNDKIILTSDKSSAFYDSFPVTQGHTLIIPKRHVKSYFELEPSEKEDIWNLVDNVKNFLDENFNPDGYNIGINIGETAGQTVFHCHIHVIPRYKGDIANPKGGVRGVIPDKQKY